MPRTLYNNSEICVLAHDSETLNIEQRTDRVCVPWFLLGVKFFFFSNPTYELSDVIGMSNGLVCRTLQNCQLRK